MRVMYQGLDGRTRVAEANRIKFLEDGFKSTDNQTERDDKVKGSALVVHLYRQKGGKRLIMQADRFNMDAAMREVLETGWIDLTSCTVTNESFY